MKKLLLLFSLVALGTAAFAYAGSDSECCDRANAKCSPTGTCTACSNCSQCKHCKAGGTCSVCKPKDKKAEKLSRP